ncbi:hypothetical protein FLAVO9R_120171 [Flavobacterium sp. 9R]|uniref:hypothetical protein n=1 Tax=Flavobacterium sp. 9R TaxID=2653143 RepID=UPI0012F3B92C|nr:hypothetical protein [Flavobacterium sp. 9R]VXB28636.1 hypothetical protein FLAVO9R_120171 [Flavobacterium sp. 9R]
MKTEKKQAKTHPKFNLEKMKVAQLDNLYLINGGDSYGFDKGDDPGTVTDKDKGTSSKDCGGGGSNSPIKYL